MVKKIGKSRARKMCGKRITALTAKHHGKIRGVLLLMPLGRLSAKRETDNHPLCGWATKVIPKNLPIWYNKMLKSIAT